MTDPRATHSTVGCGARLSRRSLSKGAAWAAPAIAVAQAVPAMAASTAQQPLCGTTSAPWRYVTYGTSAGTYELIKSSDGQLVDAKRPSAKSCEVPTTKVTMPLTVNQTTLGDGTTTGDVKYRVDDCNLGKWDIGYTDNRYGGIPEEFWASGTDKRMLVLGQNARTDFESRFTFTATESMYNVQLYVTDIDNQATPASYYWDLVYLDKGSKLPTSVEKLGGNSLVGPTSGSSAANWTGSSNGWRASASPTATDMDNTSNAGTILLKFNQLSRGESIALHYGTYAQNPNAEKTTGNWQFIFISPIRYTSVPCRP